MIGFAILFVFISIWGVRFKWKGYNDDFLSKHSTDAIKGIFIIVVFMNHIGEYYNVVGADLNAWYDKVFFLIPRGFGQLMVVMFLFYSGYGVMESIKQKGKGYVNSMPKKRLLTTIANFDVAVVIFVVVSFILGIKHSGYEILLSFIGWESVGNSNWYIFTVVVCYALTYVSYRLNAKSMVLYACFLILVFAISMSFLKGTWWYNTIFAYAVGLVFSEHKDYGVSSMKLYYMKWILVIGSGFLVSLAIYLFFYGHFKGEWEQVGALVFNIMSSFFAILVVMMTMKIKIGNNVLMWLGLNLFPLYIYQRLPMMLLTELYPEVLVASHPYIFLIICACATAIIAYSYKWIRIQLA